MASHGRAFCDLVLLLFLLHLIPGPGCDALECYCHPKCNGKDTAICDDIDKNCFKENKNGEIKKGCTAEETSHMECIRDKVGNGRKGCASSKYNVFADAKLECSREGKRRSVRDVSVVDTNSSAVAQGRGLKSRSESSPDYIYCLCSGHLCNNAPSSRHHLGHWAFGWTAAGFVLRMIMIAWNS